MSITSEQQKWLGQFIQAIDEDDWLYGIDLYRENKLTKLTKFQNLISASVQTLDGQHEVRLKLHPNGHMIQWVECTCIKNRKKGKPCEHIAALLFQFHQESPSPNGGNSTPQEFLKDSTEANQTAVNGLLLQGKGNILKVEEKNSNLYVTFEVKPGQTSRFELDVDVQPNFLSSLASIEKQLLPTTYQKMEVKEKNFAIQGLYFYLDENQKLVGKKVLALKKSPSKATNIQPRIHEKFLVKYKDLSEKSWYEIYPEDEFKRWIGDKYFVVPEIGYFKIENKFEKWSELPSTVILKDEEAIHLINDGFKRFLDQGYVFLNSALQDIKVVDNLEFSDIRLVDEKEGWFYLDPRYSLDGQNVSFVDLLKNYSNKDPFLKTKKLWMKVPDFFVEGQWSVDPKQKCLKLSNLELLKLRQKDYVYSKLSGKEYLLDLFKEATEFNHSKDIPSIDFTHLTLRDYQTKGLAWLWWLYTRGLHGLLADDMGLGKTHQAMGIMSAIQSHVKGKKKDPLFLCICPTTVLDHWVEKIEKFAPNLKPLKYYGSRRESLVKNISSHTTVVTTYGILLREIKLLEKFDWQMILLDEAHFVKNNKTATYNAARQLRGRLRLCLTGTPMENHLMELKNIFDFIVPGYLGSDKNFQKNFVTPIINHKDPQKEDELRRLISPLKLRRTKEEVLNDLPEKIEDIRHCWLSNDQIALYKHVLQTQALPILNSLKDREHTIPYLHIFSILQLLKQICNHPAMLKKSDDWKDGESGKFELFRTLLSEALESNHKVVIYSQYLGMIDIIKKYLRDINVEHVVLTGKTKNRGEVIEKFQNDPEVKVFVGSLLAGGIGIDLTSASVVIHYDRWWNASKEDQATDRVHRIGQKNFIQVLKLVTRGTLEDKIDEMITKKADLFNRFLESDKEAFKSFTREELIDLLQ